MRHSFSSLTGVLSIAVLGCGGSNTAVQSQANNAASNADASNQSANAHSAAADTEKRAEHNRSDTPTDIAAKTAVEEDITPTLLPRECTSTGKLCVPPSNFVDRLCQGKYPGAAIVMFEKKAPWTRGYVRMPEIVAVNALGGPASDTKLVFAEEVLVLRHRGGGNGKMQVSGSVSFDVFRWDGTCATLAEHEWVTWMPGAPQTAPITWRFIDDGIRDALAKDDKIEAARKTHRTECQGATLGSRSSACERATKRLNDSIATAVRRGIDLPEPDKLP